MALHDARGDGQAESRAGVLGGEERIEKSLLHVRRNAFATILYFQDDDVGCFVVEVFPIPSRPELDHSALANGLGGVADEVDQHLFDLIGIGGDQEGRGLGQDELDVVLGQFRLEKSINIP